MTGYLQSKERAKDRLKFDDDDQSISPIMTAESLSLPLIGSYSMVEGSRVCLYRIKNELWLLINNDLPINLEDVEVDWKTSMGRVDLVVRRGAERLIEEHYSLSPDIAHLEDDPTPFVEAEDFDFFLFVRNVLSDAGRRQRIYS